MKEWLAFVALSSALGVVMVHCKPAEAPLPDYCYDEAKLQSVLNACATLAPTREEWLTCRTSVNASCGMVVTVTDGGVP